MKIKTLTCHDVYNFGATLQAYALMKYVKSLGYNLEIINYKPDYLSYNLWSIGTKWKKNILLRLFFYAYVVPKRISLRGKRKKFDNFTKNYLSLSESEYQSIDELKANIPIADIYFVGSDQVWNTELSNGKDPAFFLDFIPENAIKASYAASFGVSEIASEYFDFVKDKLKTFDFISVREITGINILESMGIDDGSVVVDPVFLLERSSWEKLARFQASEKYIFIYDQENNQVIKKAALILSKLFNLRIIAIESLYPMSYAHKRIKGAGPEEFVGLIKNCEICLTNSFHCLAFSVMFNKNFYLFKRTHQKVNSRMIDLLEYLGLSDRIGDDQMDNLNIDSFDYTMINNLIERRKKSSFNYIEKVLEKAKENK